MESQPQLVLFPYMAQGHVTPFLALAKFIEERHPSFTITLINTPFNIQSLQSFLPPTSTIRLRSLPFNGADHGLPPNSENTDSLTDHHRVRLFLSSASLQLQFERFLSELTSRAGSSPQICVIADVFFGWTVDIAKKLGIFHATFSTGGAYGTAGYFYLWLNLAHIRTDSTEFGLPGFPEGFRLRSPLLSNFIRDAMGNNPWTPFFQRQITLSLGSDSMLCNTVDELETEGLRLLRENSGLRVWPIGPLLPLDKTSSSYQRNGKKPGLDMDSCMRWLGKHPAASVLYVSFGSQTTISPSQIMALAMGLEASGAPFIWVIRPPSGFDSNEEFRAEWLPEEFEARLSESGRGLLIKIWAPQMEILSHSSTGAFLSHCGWNSVLESLSRDVPVIGFPFGPEQHFNLKLMEEELGVCVELKRGVGDVLEHREVERVIRLVMDGDKGKEMRQKVVGLREMIRAAMREEGGEKGSSLKAIDDFIRTVITETSLAED